jgi:hypothetical protein
MKLLLCLCERNVAKERVREIKNNDINQHKQSFSSCLCSPFLRDHFEVNCVVADPTGWLGTVTMDGFKLIFLLLP